MLNIHELEKRHFNYKLKSYIPYVTIFISITVIAGIIFTFSNINVFSKDDKKVEINNIPKKILEVKKVEITQNTIEEKVETKPEKIEQKKEVIKQEFNNIIEKDNKIIAAKIQNIEDNKPETKSEKLVLTPSMNFIEKINTSPSATLTYKEPVKKEKTTPKQPKVKEVPRPKTQQSRQVLTKEEKSSILIKKNNTYDDIHHVIKRFKKNNNPALSLFIAKKYYELGEYKKSYNYALRTNEINNNIEVSWIIFAKSLVKLNKKDLAIKTLKKYINHSDSNKAKILLDEIYSGKLHAD